MDDLLIDLASYAEAVRGKTIIEETFTDSGLTREMGKDQFKPTQVFVDHLGFRISSKGLGLITVQEQQCYHLQGMAMTLLCQSARDKRRVPSVKLRKFSGTAISCMETVPQARLRLRSIFDAPEE